MQEKLRARGWSIAGGEEKGDERKGWWGEGEREGRDERVCM